MVQGGSDDEPDDRKDLTAALHVVGCEATTEGTDVEDDDLVVIDLTGVRAGKTDHERLVVRAQDWDGLHHAVLEAVGRPVEEERERRWARFAGRLECCIRALDPEEFLVLHTPLGRFVQLMVRHGEIRVETVSNQYLPESEHLPFEELDRLGELRWNPPTRILSEVANEQGSPNHWVHFEADAPVDVIASMLIATLRLVHRVGEPEDLTYQAADLTGRRIVIPTMGLSRTVDPQPPA